MLRTWLTLTALASAAPAHAKCPVPGRVVLSAEEFSLAGYDAERGVVGVRPVALLAAGPQRAHPMRLALPDQPFQLKVAADQVQALADAQAGGQLELVVAVRPAPGPRPPDDCATYVPDAPQLRLKGEAVAPAAVPASEALPAPAPPPQASAVRLAHPSTEPDGAEFPTARTQRFTREAAERCLAKADGPVPNGALMVELGVSPAGAPRPVKVVLDQLMHPGVRECLTRTLDDTPGMWADWPPGGLMYQPVYFRVGATSAGTGPDASGSKAP